MRTVDQVDMQMSFSEFLRKSVKWYKEIAFHLIDLVVFNACFIQHEKSSKSIFLFQITTNCTDCIIEKHGSKHKSVIGRP